MSAAYRPDIDALRGIAVAAVVLFHAFPDALPGGFIGVDVFFVISGYLITGIVARDLEAGRFSLWRFYSRRVNRIVPALLAVLLACALAGWWLLLSGEYRMLGTHTAGASIFGSNFVLLGESGYFDEAAHTKPLLHLWSLGIEEQFYIAWPMALWLTLRLGRAPARMAGIAAVLSFAAAVWIVSFDKAAAFYHPLLRAWELLVGGLLALVQQRRPAGPQPHLPHSAMVGVLGVAAMLAPMLWIDRHALFPGAWALLPTIGTVAIIGSDVDAPVNRALGRSRLLVWMGLISFPLYLWHWPLLTFARIVAGDAPALALRLALVGVAVALAWLTYRFVERHARAPRRAAAKSWALVSGLAGVGLAGLALAQSDGLPWRPSVARYEAKAQDLRGPAASGRGLPCRAEGKDPGPPLRYCLVSRAGPATAALLGDSHADHLFDGLAQADSARNWLLIGHPSTPPLLDVTTRMGGDGDDRQARAEAAIRYVAGNPAIRTVVIAYFGNTYLLDESVAPAFERGGPRTQATLSSARWPGLGKEELIERGLGRTVDVLRESGKHVILFAGVPELAFLPKDCIGRPASSLFRRACELARPAVDARRARHLALLQRVASSRPEIDVFDPIGILCDEARCRFDSPDGLFYRDWHHLSVPGSHLVGAVLVDWLRDHDGHREVPSAGR